jgi:hypothetical protein
VRGTIRAISARAARITSTAQTRRRLVAEPEPERTHQCGATRERFVALAAARREEVRMLEAREYHGLTAERARLGLELAREREQQAFVATAKLAPIGDQLERRAGWQVLASARRQAIDGSRRRVGWQRPRAPEQPALAEGRTERARPSEVFLGLDALRQQRRAGALGLRGDGVEDARRCRRGARPRCPRWRPCGRRDRASTMPSA